MRGWSVCWDEFVESEPLDELIPSNWNTLAETSVRPWKLIVGRRSFPFGFRPISSCVLVCFREGRFHFTLLDSILYREPGMCDSERKIPSIHKLTHWLRLESLGALLHYIIPQPSVGSGMGETLVTKVSPVRLLYTLELKYPIVMGERKIETVKPALLRFYTPMSP